jgi:hypothetical protein
MSTPVVPAAPSKVSLILTIIQAALGGLTLIPGVGTVAGVSEIFVKILQTGLAAYQVEVGQPLDLTKIPIETPVP